MGTMIWMSRVWSGTITTEPPTGDDAEDAKKYEVRLYRNGSSVTSVKTTSNTDYNFSDEFTRSGDYYFRVRAVRNSSNKGTWEESEELSVTSSEAREIRENGESSSNSSSSGGPRLQLRRAWE